MATVFTKIINGEIPGNFAWADEICVVFASINPISEGHMLVVPRQEVAKFTDASDELLAHLMSVAAKVGRAQQAAFDAPRAALLVAGFEVPHLHLHVVPAWGEAELSFANAAASVNPAVLQRATQQVRDALVAQGDDDAVPQHIDHI